MIWIFPLISLFAWLLLALIVDSKVIFDRYLCLLIFIPTSLLWSTAIGFGGDDIETYLRYFGSYSFVNPFFEGSPTEFSVGFLSSIISTFFSKPKDIAVVYRIVVFSLVPSLIISGSSNPKTSTGRLACLLFYLFLTPYTFLSASNIINNGFSIAFLTYAFVLSLSLIYRHVLYVCKISIRLVASVFILVFCAIFAHPFGMSSVFILATSIFLLNSLNISRLLNPSLTSSRIRRFILFVVPVFCALSFFAIGRLSSTDADSTILVSSALLLVVLACSRTLLYYYIKSSRVTASLSAGTVSFALASNLLWMSLAAISVFSIVLGLIGGGDASERYIAFSIQSNLLYSVFLIVYLGSTIIPDRTRRFYLSNPLIHSSSRSPAAIFRYYPLIVSFAWNVFFFSSKAFIVNAS